MARASAAVLLFIASASGQKCTQTFPGANPGIPAASFDLSGLMGSDYTWQDSRSETETGYDYTFAFCGPVQTLPPACAAVSPNWPGTNYPAIQWQKNPGNTLTNLSSKVCNPISMPISPSGGTANPYSFALIDPNNPAYGVSLIYNAFVDPTNAFACPTNADGTPGGRQLTLTMRCAYEPFPAPSATYAPTETFITEEGICNYVAYSWTQAGCPTECKIGSNGQTCSARGICGFDTEIQTSRCFCDDGYLSSDCAVVANPFPSGAVAGALFGGLILTAGVMLGVAFYLARRSKATSSVDGFYGQVAA